MRTTRYLIVQSIVSSLTLGSNLCWPQNYTSHVAYPKTNYVNNPIMTLHVYPHHLSKLNSNINNNDKIGVLRVRVVQFWILPKRQNE